jgi:ATP-dependent Clp protease protease subunit
MTLKRKAEECEEGAHAFTGENYAEQTFQYLLSEKRTILLNSVIDDNIIERVVIPIMGLNEADDEAERELNAYSRDMNPIKIIINSNGGSVTEVLSCISAIEQSKTPVHTFALGKAYSGGFYILLAGHKRFCQRNSTLLYHQVQGQPPGGAVRTSQEWIDESERLQKMLDHFTLRRSKIKPEVLKEVNKQKKDWYINSLEARKLGLVDGYFY